METAVRPAKNSPGSRDAFADVDVLVEEVLTELDAMARDGGRPMWSEPKPPLAGAGTVQGRHGDLVCLFPSRRTVHPGPAFAGWLSGPLPGSAATGG